MGLFSVFIIPPPLAHRANDCLRDLTVLWEEYREIHPEGYGYSRFCVTFQMAEVAIAGGLFADILRMIGELRPPPVTSTA
jgi:hypothetical protein